MFLLKLILILIVLAGILFVWLFRDETLSWAKDLWSAILERIRAWFYVEPMALGNSGTDRALERRQFIAVQEKFFGIYENLYLVAQAGGDTPQCNLTDWDIRMEELSGAPDLVRLWKALRGHPAEFLAFVMDCGVQRDGRKTIEAGSETRYSYFLSDGTPLEPGRTYAVLLPCWKNGTVLLERGILNRI